MKEESPSLNSDPEASGSSGLVVSTIEDLVAAPANTVMRVNGALLVEHPLNIETFGKASVDKDAALEQSVRVHGVQTALQVAGRGCASPTGTIIAGARRWSAAQSAGMSTVPCLVMHDMSADAEVCAAIESNLAHGSERDFTEEKLFDLEQTLREAMGRRQGQRSDVATSVGSNPGSDVRGPTKDIVAAQTGASGNAVKDRQKIFTSPHATEQLKQAVNSKALPRSVAAALLRKVEREATPVAAGADDMDAQIAAKKKAEEMVSSELARRASGKSSSRGKQPKGPQQRQPQYPAVAARTLEDLAEQVEKAVAQYVNAEASVRMEAAAGMMSSGLPSDANAQVAYVVEANRRAMAAVTAFKLARSLGSCGEEP